MTCLCHVVILAGGRRKRKLIRSFISRPQCLIFAVSSATSDLATSDAIQLAKGTNALLGYNKQCIDLLNSDEKMMKMIKYYHMESNKYII